MQQMRLLLSCFGGHRHEEETQDEDSPSWLTLINDLPLELQEQVLPLPKLQWSARQTCKLLRASFDTDRTTLTLRWPHSPRRRDWATLSTLLARLPNLRQLDAACRPPSTTVAVSWAASCLQRQLPWLALPSLTALNLKGSTLLTDVSPLTACTLLETLCLSKCIRLHTVWPLAACRRLTSLDVSCCEGLADARSFATVLPALAILNLSWSGCSAISAGLGTCLLELNLADACLAEYAPLAAFTLLERLDLSYSSIADLTPLAACTLLTHLRLDGCRMIAELAPLAACTALVTLSAWLENQLTDIRPLAALQRLAALELRLPHLTDVRPLQQCAALQWLLLIGCPRVLDARTVLAAQVDAGLRITRM